MSSFKDFLMEEFDDSVEIEKEMKIGGKKKIMKFRPISADTGDEIRRKCKKTEIYNGQITTDIDQVKFIANMIIETTVHPDLKNAELQKAWGVLGAEDLLKAMKTKMRDGEYTQWGSAVSEVNGYNDNMNTLIKEAKN